MKNHLVSQAINVERMSTLATFVCLIIGVKSDHCIAVSHWVSHWVGTTLLPNRKVIFVVCCSYAFAMLLPFGCLTPNHSKFEFAQNLSKSHHATKVFTAVGLCSILSFMLIYRSCYIWFSPFSKQSNWSLTYIWSSFIGLKNSIKFEVSMS